MIRAEGITKRFGATLVLSGVSLSLDEGESLAITGPSGSGKSTLLHILGSLEPMTSGSLLFRNRPIDPAPFRNQHCGFVFQSSHLLEELSLLDNLLLKARIGRRAGSEAHDLLDQVGLSHRKHFLAKHLSGGEKQRGAIARALMNNPDLILADEPTGNLDHNSALQIQDLLFTCCQKSSKSLIVVTHDELFANRAKHRLHLSRREATNDPNLY